MFSVDIPESGSVSCHTLWESEIHTQQDVQPSFIFLMGSNGFNQKKIVYRL